MTTDENKDLSSILVGIYDNKNSNLLEKLELGLMLHNVKNLIKSFLKLQQKSVRLKMNATLTQAKILFG